MLIDSDTTVTAAPNFFQSPCAFMMAVLLYCGFRIHGPRHCRFSRFRTGCIHGGDTMEDRSMCAWPRSSTRARPSPKLLQDRVQCSVHVESKLGNLDLRLRGSLPTLEPPCGLSFCLSGCHRALKPADNEAAICRTLRRHQ